MFITDIFEGQAVQVGDALVRVEKHRGKFRLGIEAPASMKIKQVREPARRRGLTQDRSRH